MFHGVSRVIHRSVSNVGPDVRLLLQSKGQPDVTRLARAATPWKEGALALAQDTCPSPTSVYRYYDASDVLIYVGITKQAMGRNAQHNNGAEWWPFVARQEIDHFPTRQQASVHEKALIRRFHPPFNKHYNLDWRELRTAYLAYAAGEREPETLLQAYQRIGRCIPLHVLEHHGQKRVLLRTSIEHAQLAARLAIFPPTPLFTNSKVGKVSALDHRAVFTVIHCTLTRPVEIESVTASIRWRQSSHAEPEHIELRNLQIIPVRADL